MSFVHPSTVLVSGMTQSGKSLFVAGVIASRFFEPMPTQIIWLYSDWQVLYDAIKIFRPDVRFIRIGTEEQLAELYDGISGEEAVLLIIDDQMEIGAKSNTLSKFFTKGSHHKNMSVVYLVQNLFDKGKSQRTVSLNAHYILLFKNPRDKSQAEVLARQMYPGKWRAFLKAFEDATRKPHSYLLVDLRPDTPEACRLRAKILPWKTPAVVYELV